MNKFLAMLLLTISLTTEAVEPIAWIVNQAGGRIVLTDSYCKSEPKKGLAYSTSTTNKPIYGCWSLNVESRQIFIKWESDGKISIYDEKDLEP